jgi:hypothetical protein
MQISPTQQRVSSRRCSTLSPSAFQLILRLVRGGCICGEDRYLRRNRNLYQQNGLTGPDERLGQTRLNWCVCSVEERKELLP